MKRAHATMTLPMAIRRITSRKITRNQRRGFLMGHSIVLWMQCILGEWREPNQSPQWADGKCQCARKISRALQYAECRLLTENRPLSWLGRLASLANNYTSVYDSQWYSQSVWRDKVNTGQCQHAHNDTNKVHLVDCHKSKSPFQLYERQKERRKHILSWHSSSWTPLTTGKRKVNGRNTLPQIARDIPISCSVHPKPPLKTHQFHEFWIIWKIIFL